jgi:hypothetical protein
LAVICQDLALTTVRSPNNTYNVLVNGQSEKTGSLLEDFEPAFNPPKEIDDPEDSKPEDWVDEEKIPDPDAKKVRYPCNWSDLVAQRKGSPRTGMRMHPTKSRTKRPSSRRAGWTKKPPLFLTPVSCFDTVTVVRRADTSYRRYQARGMG